MGEKVVIRIDRDLLVSVIDKLYDVTDEGPEYAGWKSNELSAFIGVLERAVEEKPRG